MIVLCPHCKSSISPIINHEFNALSYRCCMDQTLGTYLYHAFVSHGETDLRSEILWLDNYEIVLRHKSPHLRFTLKYISPPPYDQYATFNTLIEMDEIPNFNFQDLNQVRKKIKIFLTFQ